MKTFTSKTMQLFLSVVVALSLILSCCDLTAEAASSKYVTSLSLNTSSVSVKVGQETTVKATVKVNKSADKKVTATSSDSQIATVSVGKANSKGISNIKIKVKKAGKATITVTTVGKDKKGKKISKKINVSVPGVTSLSLNSSSVSTYIGKSTTVKATVKASSSVDKGVTVTSSDPQIATVSVGKANSNGVSSIKIKGKKAGKATITVTTVGKNKNSKKETKKINVSVKKVLSADQSSITVGQDKVSVKITFRQDGEVDCDIDDPDLVSYSWGKFKGDDTTLTFYAKKKGTTYATVTNSFNNEKVKIKIKSTKEAQAPQYNTWVSDSTDSRASAVFVSVTNNGKLPFYAYSKNARLIDHDYRSFDRDLYLIDEDGVKNGYLNRIDSLKIAPGQSAILCFMVDGDETWYDAKSTIKFDFKYDGITYVDSTSRYYGGGYYEK